MADSRCSPFKGFAPYRGLQHFFDLAVHGPGITKSWLKKPRVSAASDAKEQAVAHRAHKRQGRGEQPEAAFDARDILRCSQCSLHFATPQQLCVHRANRHGIRALVDRFLGSSVCRACLMDFRTRKRLLRHVLHDSRACATTLQYVGPLPDGELQEVRQASAAFNSANRASGFSLSAHTLPAVRLCGPLPRARDDLHDPSLLALMAELSELSASGDYQGFLKAAGDSVELLVNSSVDSFQLVLDVLPTRYSSVLGGLRH